MSFSNLTRRLNQIANNVDRNSDTLVRRVALSVDSVVVVATPVDTGRARSNWQVEIGSMPTSTIEPYSPGTAGSTAGANSQAAIDQAAAKIALHRTGQEIHVTNNLDYIGDLNSGKSPQAPPSYVQEAIAIGVSRIRGASLLTDVTTETI